MALTRQAAMDEAHRRWKSFHPEAKHPAGLWLGLGTLTAYKAALKGGLMRLMTGTPHHRHNNWFVLTEKGVEEVLKLESTQIKTTIEAKETV